MVLFSGLLLGVMIAIDVAGPAVVLLLVRRRTRRWWVAFAGTLAVAPVAAFLLTGGLAWLATYLHVVVGGDTSVPDQIGQTVPQYLRWTFGICGVYGAMFACTGFGFSLPVLGAWRLFHSASFGRAFRARPDRPRSAAEQDYDDAAATRTRESE